MSGAEVLPLGEVVSPTRPRVKPSDYPDLPFIGMEHVEAHSMRLLGTVPAATMKSSAVHFKPGDVLYGRLRPYLNKVYRPTFSGVCSAEFIVLPESERVDGGYLQYFLNSSAFVRFASQLNTGDRPRVDFDQLAPYEIPLPSINEQRRIVAEIEKQFSRLDEAVANLKRVKANLKRYKAAVLKAAVEGRLVPAEAELAPRQSRHYETGAKLLKRVLEERRAKWRKGTKFSDAAAPTHIDDFALPVGWTWASLEQLCTVFVDSAHRTPKYGEGAYPAIGPRDVVGGLLSLERVRLVSECEYLIQVARHIPKPGDVVYSRELSLGWGAVLPAEANVCLSQGMCLFRPAESISAKYFLTVLNTPFVRRQAESLAAGSAHPHLNLSDIKALAFPLPPRPEQDRIVGEVERLITGLESADRTAEESLARARGLRQALVASAFRPVERIEFEDGVVP